MTLALPYYPDYRRVVDTVYWAALNDVPPAANDPLFNPTGLTYAHSRDLSLA